MVLAPRVTAADVARDHPVAVRFARQFREVFGDGVKLTYAENFQTGSKLGIASLTQPVLYTLQPRGIARTA